MTVAFASHFFAVLFRELLRTASRTVQSDLFIVLSFCRCNDVLTEACWLLGARSTR